MKLANGKNKFTIEDAIVSTVYQVRVCTQTTTNVTPFQAHFGRKQVTGERSDILIEEAMTKAQLDAGRRNNRETRSSSSMGHVGPLEYGGTYFTNENSHQRTRCSRGESTQQ